MGIWIVAMVISEMQRLGGFYLYQRRGLQPALWRLSERGVAPVTPKSLTAFLQEREVDNTQVLASSVLALSFSNELPHLFDDMIDLIDPRKSA
jgi:hypothetical protein